MSMLSNLDLIRRVPLFALLTPEQAALLSDAVEKRRFKRGELIVEKGKKSNSLFIILAGRARVVITDRKGREVILASLQPGDYIGEMSLIDNDPHSASVETEVQTDVLVLGRAEFTRCLAENASMSYSVMKGLVQRLRKADEKIGSLALLGVYGRVADVLMGRAVPDGEKRMLIREKISRQDIAKMVGASREMVSRVMRDFEDHGFIETREGGAVVITERRSVPR
ncbi:Crp/Fnr family transcriptional regulator [Rhodoferax sp.]|uniref:Crp/Fnr family transcriptional regulator n=1 Tax=Rhodoferax sp. TaxID=50421 RepID=UPI001EBAB30F|nr:Crp/Fnr family transcriptional regulator [Rhodoferax sp.]MBT9505638.1 Crp/Fnr family transcriptional regulator [Rhodoferax sp.]